MKLLLLFTALPVLALACIDGYDTWMDGRCFRITNIPSNFDRADQQCKRDGAQLPTINSTQENDQFFAVVDRFQFAFSFWLGLSCDGEKFAWADGSVANYTNFAGDYNCTSESTGRRYYVGRDRKWHESSDGQSYGANNNICEGAKRDASLCDNYETLVSENSTGICYKLQKNALDWYQAHQECKMQGAELSIVHDRTMNDLIKSTAVEKGLMHGLHIGLQKGNLGNYSWVDGSAMDYNNFAAGFPIKAYGDCVAMQTSFMAGQWMNVNCYDTQLPYMCTKPVAALNTAQPQPEGCPAKIQYGPGDEIYSPAYPQAPGVSECDYLLLEPNMRRVQLEISFFESNSCCDTLTIYDGLFGGNVILRVTGYYPVPVTVRAYSNAMRMHWNATSGVNVRGFRAKMTSF